MIRTALFSEDKKYRHMLGRLWYPDALDKPLGCFIEKNPSSADAFTDDPTMIKNINYGISWGWRGLLQLNMFDYIATDSTELVRIGDSVAVSEKGLVSCLVEVITLHGCTPVVCSWGTHTNRSLRERIQSRGEMIVRKLIEAGIEPMCLQVNKDGTPSHTLYLPGKLKPIPYQPFAQNTIATHCNGHSRHPEGK